MMDDSRRQLAVAGCQRMMTRERRRSRVGPSPDGLFQNGGVGRIGGALEIGRRRAPAGRIRRSGLVPVIRLAVLNYFKKQKNKKTKQMKIKRNHATRNVKKKKETGRVSDFFSDRISNLSIETLSRNHPNWQKFKGLQ